ncbi:MAG TPA: hypothetical protein VGB92_15605, partial [Longimicrobium sp.]
SGCTRAASVPLTMRGLAIRNWMYSWSLTLGAFIAVSYLLTTNCVTPIRVIEDTTGVYHPKVIVGKKDGLAMAILGSSNFTSGGFAGNTELNVLLKGSRDNPAFSEILDFIEALWGGPRSFVPDRDWLARYTRAYERRPHAPRLPQPNESTANLIDEQDLNVTWREYYELIRGQERRTLANHAEIHVFDHPDGSYLQEAEACRHALTEYPMFRVMPLDRRKLVAGWGRDSSGYFGRMSGAGYFKNMVVEKPEALAQFLDAIPLTGYVSFEQVEECLRGLTALHGVDLGAASRLLCMKRQDLFVPYNKANIRRIAEIFGRAKWSVSGYIELHERIWRFEWIHASEPINTDERRVWHARVSLLDSLVYEATSTTSAPPGFSAVRE